jgi:hypothetical protein
MTFDAGPNWRERAVARLWRTLAAWLPRSLVYFAAVRVAAHANCGRWRDEDPQQMQFFTALRRWHQSS